jgi:hypothetical protein
VRTILRDDLLNRYASSRSRYRGRGSHGVVPARRAVSAFYAVLVHRLAGLPSLRSRHASWASPASVRCYRSFPYSPSLPSHGRSPFRSWLQMVVSSFSCLVFLQGTCTPFTSRPCWEHARRGWQPAITSPVESELEPAGATTLSIALRIPD